MWKKEPDRQRRPKPPPSEPPVQPRHSSYDSDTGQIYSESQVHVSSRHHSDWIGELRTPSLEKRTQPHGHGARSLFETAKIKVAAESRNLSAEHLSMVPWPIGKQIWEDITMRRIESFRVWRAFAASYSKASEFGQPQYRYHLQIRQPSLVLQSYFNGLTSRDASWLTCLRISPKETRTADLVGIANIINLTALDLSDGRVTIDTRVSAFDERVLRTWSELAQSGRAFQHLRVLLFGWQEQLSFWLFKYLSHFPALERVIMTDCPHLHQRNRKDWEQLGFDAGFEARHAKKSAKGLRPTMFDPEFQQGAISGLYYVSANGGNDTDTDTASENLRHVNDQAGKPLLECWLGTPRTWNHIVDDFPGTKTIWFDKVLDSSRHIQLEVVKKPTKHERPTSSSSNAVYSAPQKRNAKAAPKMRQTKHDITNVLVGFQ